MKRVLLVLLVVATAYGCSVRDPWEDARIESEVKAGLVAQKNANLTRLGVASRQTVVYLTGAVAASEEKALAESVARNVRGVTRVVSTLEIRSTPAVS